MSGCLDQTTGRSPSLSTTWRSSMTSGESTPRQSPVRSVHAKPWQHGGYVARQTILITPFLMLGAIPNLRNGPQTAVLPTVANGLQSVKRGTWEHLCKSDAGRQLVG